MNMMIYNKAESYIAGIILPGVIFPKASSKINHLQVKNNGSKN